MESDLYAYLDSIHSTEVYNTELPQDISLPVIRFENITTRDEATHHEGGGNCETFRFQIDHYATTKAAANALADTTKALHARRGLVGTKTCVSFRDSQRGEKIEEVDAFVVSADYIITSIE